MTKTDHLAKAKDYIAKGDEYYARAADEIAAWLAEDESRTQAQAGEALGVSDRQVRRLLQARLEGRARPTWDSGSNKRDEVAAKVLRTPEQRRRVLAELPAAEIEAVIEDANDVALDRLRAKRSEHDARPTTRDLMGDDPFKPDEFWADNVVIAINRKARELASLIQRGGGLLLGAMAVEEAFDYLNESERLIAEARAAAQEQTRDKARV